MTFCGHPARHGTLRCMVDNNPAPTGKWRSFRAVAAAWTQAEGEEDATSAIEEVSCYAALEG